MLHTSLRTFKPINCLVQLTAICVLTVSVAQASVITSTLSFQGNMLSDATGIINRHFAYRTDIGVETSAFWDLCPFNDYGPMCYYGAHTPEEYKMMLQASSVGSNWNKDFSWENARISHQDMYSVSGTATGDSSNRNWTSTISVDTNSDLFRTTPNAFSFDLTSIHSYWNYYPGTIPLNWNFGVSHDTLTSVYGREIFHTFQFVLYGEDCSNTPAGPCTYGELATFDASNAWNGTSWPPPDFSFTYDNYQHHMLMISHRVTVGELRTLAVPEPSAAALLVFGFAGLWFAARQRRKM